MKTTPAFTLLKSLETPDYLRYIVGIDPGTRSFGMAILNSQGEYIRSWQIDLVVHSKTSLSFRLQQVYYAVYGKLITLVEASKWMAVPFIEDVPLVKGNVRTLTALHQAIGVIQVPLLTCWRFSAPRLIKPATIKSRFVGDSKATDDQVQKLAKLEFELDVVGVDEASALSIAKAGHSLLLEERWAAEGKG